MSLSTFWSKVTFLEHYNLLLFFTVHVSLHLSFSFSQMFCIGTHAGLCTCVKFCKKFCLLFIRERNIFCCDMEAETVLQGNRLCIMQCFEILMLNFSTAHSFSWDKLNKIP